MLSLRDEVGGDVPCIGRAVGEDGHLGGAGLAVDADDPLQSALRRGDVDVPRAGDEVDRLAGRAVLEGDAIGEHRHRLSTPDRVDLVHAEQPAGGEDRRMRPSVVVALRGRDDDE